MADLAALLAQAVGPLRPKASPIGPYPGLLKMGNIDLEHRPVVHLPDGSIATVDSSSWNLGGRETLLPTVSPEGRMLSGRDAIDLYRRTGQHLGQFATPEDADRYAQALHEAQARYYEGR
jgi:hypothetical protein